MDARQTKGEQISQIKSITEVKDGWIVPSQTSDKTYLVSKMFECNCPDHRIRSVFCKHAYAVHIHLHKKSWLRTER